MLYYKPTKKSLITSVSLETQPEEYKYTFVRPVLPIKKFTANKKVTSTPLLLAVDVDPENIRDRLPTSAESFCF